MLIYMSLLVGALALGILLCKNKKGNLIYCIVMGIVMFVVASLRRSVGHDYNNYALMYMRSMTLDIEEIAVQRTEKGYSIITKLLADYFYDYQTIFIVCAAFFAVCVAVAAYKYCKRPYLGICFFLTFGVYFNTFNFLRQEIAGFIVFFAIMHCVKKDQFFRFCIMVLLASCFHLSAILMIPFYFLLKIKITPVTLGIYGGLTVLIYIFSWDIMDFITDYIYKQYQPRTSVHVLHGFDSSYLIFSIIAFVAAYVFRRRLIEKDPFNDVLISCMFFSLFFEVIGIKHSIVSRMGAYVILPAVIVLMPRLFEAALEKCREAAKSNKKRRTLFTAVTVASFAVVCTTMYGLMIVRNYNGVTPYTTVFDEFETQEW